MKGKRRMKEMKVKVLTLYLEIFYMLIKILNIFLLFQK